MNTADRRAEIINILLVRRRITAKELADEFSVTVRIIQNDIQAVRRHIVGGANRTLISAETPLRSWRIGTCRRLSAG